MKAFVWCGLLLPLLCVSCDKAREAAEKVRQEVGGLAGKTGGEGKADASLAGLVERGPEGVRFRKDLPFPETISVDCNERSTFANGRGMSHSALGTTAGVLEGTVEHVVRYERKGGAVVMTIERFGKVVETEEGDKKAPAPPKEENGDAASRLVGKSLTLHHTRQGWKAPKTAGPADFQQMSWSREVAPTAGGLFADAGLLPRPMWFPASRSWKEGDGLELAGDALGLLVSGKVAGKLSLVFEGEETVDGHPCGRFSVEGGISVKDEPSADGSVMKCERTISAGRIWCSLLYPVILKEEYDTVQSIDSVAPGGLKTRYQGGVKTLVVRAWNPG